MNANTDNSDNDNANTNMDTLNSDNDNVDGNVNSDEILTYDIIDIAYDNV